MRPEQLDMDELEYYHLSPDRSPMGAMSFTPGGLSATCSSSRLCGRRSTTGLCRSNWRYPRLFSPGGPAGLLAGPSGVPGRPRRRLLRGCGRDASAPVRPVRRDSLQRDGRRCPCSPGSCWRCRAPGRRVTAGRPLVRGGGGPRPLYALPSHVPVVQPVWGPCRVLARPRRLGRAGPRRVLRGRLPHGCRCRGLSS